MTKKSNILRTAIIGAMTLYLFCGQAQAVKPPLPPPSGLPKSLPPLPGGFKVPVQKPGTTNQNPIKITPVEEAPKPEVTYTAFDLIKEEADRLGQAAYPALEVKVISTKDDFYLSGISNGSIDLRGAYGMSSGMYGLHVYNNGGKTNQSCYIIVNEDMLPNLQRTWIDPANRLGQPRAGAAFLAGREVGRCLDTMDRYGKINTRIAWSGDDLNWLGLSRAAATRAYGEPMNKDAYLANKNKIASDVAYIQYQERGIDIFGVYWVAKLGAGKNILNMFCETRRINGIDTVSDIADATCSAGQSANEVSGLVRLDTIWDAARKKQVAVGISKAAAAGGTANSNFKSTPEEPAYWKVTPRGVVPFDANGNEIIKKN